MSNSVDKRIVEMQFDNQQFERETKTTLGTIDKLKKGLNLDAAAKSLSNLGKVGESFSLAGIAEGVDKLVGRFSTLGIAGMTVIQNLTNGALAMSKKLVDTLVINPIGDGYKDYMSKLTSVQTITNATGKSIKTVEAYFKQLDTYADKTIYNLTDMTSAFAKFTNAGVDMDKSIPAIKGIANMTALAGQDANAAQIAFYNLSQSIAGGFLTTTDYKSLNLANVATKEWKDKMIEGALAAGTLKKNTKGLYVVPGVKEALTGAELFNEALSKGWATTNVLLKVLGDYGDENTAIGKKALAAAQDVKSFGMMMETLKASIGTGWTDTFELLIGNLDESKALWTGITNALGDFISEISNARNGMLKFWKDNQGRTMLLQGIANVLILVADVLEPIEKAFAKIFPPMTGEKLLAMTKGFKELTDTFKIGEKTADNIQRTFQGIFSVVKMFGQALIPVIGAVKFLIKFLFSWGDAIFAIGGLMGDFLVSLTASREALLKFVSDGLKPIGDAFIEAFKPFSSGIWIKLADKIRELTSGMNAGEAIVNAMKTAMSGLFAVLNFGVKIVDYIASGFMDLTNWLLAFGGGVTTVYAEVENYTTGMGEAAKSNTVFGNTMNGMSGSLGAFGEGMRNVWDASVKGLQTFWDKIEPFRNAVTGVFSTIKDAISDGFGNITLDSIINAIQGGLFAGILYTLNKMFNTVNKELPDLIGSVKGVLDGATDSLKAMQTEVKSKALINIAIALGILAGAIWVLSTIDMMQLGVALGALTVMFGQLAGGMALFGKIMDKNDFSGSGKMVVGLIGMTIALNILASSMQKLSTLSWEDAAKGLTVITILMAELLLAAKFMAKNEGEMLLSAMALIGMTTAINILIGAVTNASKLSWDQIVKGLTVMTVVIGELVALIKLTKGVNFIGTATGILIVSGALVVLAGAVAIFGNMKLDVLKVGLSAMAVALLAIVMAMSYLPPGLLGSSVGILAIAVAMNVMAGAVAIFGNMKISTILQGVLSIGAVLGVLVVAMNMMQGSIGGAMALSIVAGALNLLVVPLMLLGTMSLVQLGMSLLVLSGALAILGGASFILAPVAGPMLAVAGAFALLGVGIALAGAGILAFSVGLVTLAGASAAVISLLPLLAGALSSAIVLMIKGLGLAATEIAGALGNLLRATVKEIQDSLPIIIETLSTLISLVCRAFVQLLPIFMPALRAGLDALIALIVEYTPKLVDAGVEIVIAILKGLNEDMDRLVTSATDLIVTFLGALSDNLPRIINAGMDLVLSFLNGIANSIRTTAQKIRDTVFNLLTAFIDAIFTMDSMIADIGKYIIDGLINGIKANIQRVWDIGKNIGSGVIEGVKTILKIASPSKVFRTIGKNITDGLTNGISDTSNKPEKASEKLGKDVVKGASNGVKGIDKVTDKVSTSAEKVKTAAETIQESLKTALESISAFIENRKLNGELWSLTGGKSGDDVSKLKDKLKDLTDQQTGQKKVVDQVESSYGKMVKAYGVANVESIKLENQLLKEKITYEKLGEEIESVNKAIAATPFNKSSKWVEDQKSNNSNFSLIEELAAWKRIRNTKAETAEEQIKADKEIIRLQDELGVKVSEYHGELKRLETEQKDRRKEINKEYMDQKKALKDQLSSDIADLNSQYEDAVKSRADSLYNSYGLFDKVEKNTTIVTGDGLLNNLKSQVENFETWRNNLNKLSSKGLNSALLDELEAMGPKSLDQIKALNTMSSSQLAQYATLWATKHKEAKEQATSELEGLRLANKAQIEKLKGETDTKLEELKLSWKKSLADLDENTAREMTKITTTFNRSVGLMAKNTEESISRMVTNSNTLLKAAGWTESGEFIGDGVVGGLESRRQKFLDTIKEFGEAGLDVLRKIWDINSPSKAFSELGGYAIQGLINGINSLSSEVSNSTQHVGEDVLSNLSGVLSGVQDIDYTPTIKPVIDLTNFNSGLNQMDASINANRSLMLGSLVGANGQNGSKTENLVEATKVSNTKIVEAIEGLKSDFTELVEKVGKLQVVMDTGTLVGAIGPEMDKNLGQRQIYKRRGI